MDLKKILAGTSVAIFLTIAFTSDSQHFGTFAQTARPAETKGIAVAPQYDTTHVYVSPQDFDRFVASLIATFGGKRTGYLVTDMDEAVRAAKATGADVLVAPFDDPIGRDAIIQWPGGVNTQLYWHTTAPSYATLQTIPENRVYVSPDRAEAFVRSFIAFSHGSVVSDEPSAPGVEIGRPSETYRRVRIESKFGKREAIVVQFPGGYIAEIHSAVQKQNASK